MTCLAPSLENQQDINKESQSIIKKELLPNTILKNITETFNNNTEVFLQEYSEELFEKISKNFPSVKMPTLKDWINNIIKDIYQGKIQDKQKIQNIIQNEISFTYADNKVQESFKNKLSSLLCNSLNVIKKEVKKRTYSILNLSSLTLILEEQKRVLTKKLQQKLYRSNMYRSDTNVDKDLRKERINQDIKTIVDNISQEKINDIDKFLQQKDIDIPINKKSKQNIIKLLKEANEELTLLQQMIIQQKHPIISRLKNIVSNLFSLFAS